MTDLKTLQTQLQAYMLQGDPAIKNSIVSTEKVSCEQRLNIYRNGYYWRLLDILASDLPVLKAWIGEQQFDEWGGAYIDRHPSHHYSIRVFGKAFPQFLSSHVPDQPQYAEMALLEWTLAEIQDVNNSAIVTVEEMMQVAPTDWPYVQFSMHPSVQIHHFQFNVPELWQAIIQKNPQPELEKYTMPQPVRMWRYEHECYVARLTPPEAAMLKGFAANQTFGEICELLYGYMPETEIAQFAGSILRLWVTEGMFATVQVAAQNEARDAAERNEI